MTVSDKPMMNPLSTGSETKLARNPRRKTPAIDAASPTQMASAAVVARNCPPLPETAFPTIAPTAPPRRRMAR